jgi:pimeloyl-ACP methyl ester carboxylesterase
MNIKAPYSLHDMAMDAVGVLDALKIDKAHIVGVSMGGMVAQRLALAAAERCLSLVSVMSSTGARDLPQANPAVTRMLLSQPANKSLEAAIDHSVTLFKTIGSPGFPMDDDDRRTAVAYSLKRSHYPQGLLRQMMATVADSARAAELPNIRVPTLVVHGKDDPLLPFACGEATARCIPGAKLVGIDGMGHDLPPGVVDRLLPVLVSHLQAPPPKA